MRSTTAGTVIFNVDGGADLTISTNVPTVNLVPVMILTSDAASGKNADLDFASILFRGLSR
jgi:hypothetical protein